MGRGWDHQRTNCCLPIVGFDSSIWKSNTRKSTNRKGATLQSAVWQSSALYVDHFVVFFVFVMLVVVVWL